jgi:two-component system, OmpR family, KDP operon response regulator KdpE
VGYPPFVMTSPTPFHDLASRSPSVLIIDDDEYVHGALIAALRGLRVRLLTAHTAAEGEALALENRPLLAIVDVGLPDRDGYELTGDLRRIPTLASMRVLILTGQSPDLDAAERAGADGLIQKPFRLHAFLDLVREQLGHDHDDARLSAAFARGA